MKRFFVGKSRLCLLVLLCALFFVRISYSDTCENGTCGTCPYTISADGKTLTIGNVDGTSCILPSNPGNDDQEEYYAWTKSAIRDSIETVTINSGVSTSDSAAYLFFKLKNAATWTGLGNLTVSGTTKFDYMFASCAKFNHTSQINGWTFTTDTAKSISMQGMFGSCTGMTSLTGLGDWAGKLGRVTNMQNMFSGSGLENLDPISNWNVSNVTNFVNMFAWGSSLKTIDISGWQINKNGTSYSGMFYGVTAPAKLKCFYQVMEPTRLYVYGKRDKTELTTDLSVWDSKVIFEPYYAGWTVTGVTDASTHATVTLTPVTYNRTSVAEAYYDAVKVWSGNDPYDSSRFYFEKGGGFKLVVTPEAGYRVKSIEYSDGTSGAALTALTLSTPLTSTPPTFSGLAQTVTVSNMKQDYAITVTLEQLTPATVTYAADGGTGGTVPSDYSGYVTDTIQQLPSGSGLSKPGFHFSKWNDGTKDCTVGTAYTVNAASVTMTAKYESNPSYTITYDKGDATGTPPTQDSVVEGLTATVKDNTNLAKTGFVFGGWKRSDNNETVQPGDTFTMPGENITLTAVFGKLYTLTYDPGDAETGDAPSPVSVISGVTVTVSGNTGNLKKPGYSFAGWLYDNGTTTKVYKKDDTFEMPAANITLTAQFGANVKGEMGEADSGTLPQMPTAEAGDSLTLPFNTGDLTYGEYPFIGWVDQDGNEYDAGETITMPAGTLTLKPLFSKVQYTLRYNAGEAESGAVPAAVPVYYKVNTTLSGNTGSLAKTGYDFKGWRYNNTDYDAGDTFRMPAEDVEMQAVFGLGSYTITYVMGEATSGTVPAKQTVDYNTAVTLSANSGNLAKGNAPYIGWTDGVTEYSETQSFLMPAYDMTLKPLFSTLYKLSFAAGEAESGSVPDPMDVYYNTTVTLPGNTGNLKKSGYVFKCWQDNEGTEYQAGASYEMPKANTTLTAVFIPNSLFDITYEPGDAERGTAPAPQTRIPAGTTVTLAGNSGGLAKQGYEFTYWTDGLKWYAPGSDFLMPSEDVTLWAVFAMVISEDPLPEDEYGTYYYNESGQKEYVQFHNYDICMNYMGDEDLCRNTSVNLYN